MGRAGEGASPCRADAATSSLSSPPPPPTHPPPTPPPFPPFPLIQITVVQPGVRDGVGGRNVNEMLDLGVCVVREGLGPTAIKIVADTKRLVSGWMNCEVMLDKSDER